MCIRDRHPVEPDALLGVVHLVLVPRSLRDLHDDAEVHAAPTHYAHLPSPFFTRPARLRLDQQRAHGEANLAINPLGPVGEAEVPAVEFAPARRISTVCGSATTMWATQPKSLMPAMRTMAPTRRGSATAASASTLRRPSTGCSCSQPQRGEQPVVEPPPRAGRRLHPDGDLG